MAHFKTYFIYTVFPCEVQINLKTLDVGVRKIDYLYEGGLGVGACTFCNTKKGRSLQNCRS